MGFENWGKKARMPLDCYGKRFLITLSKTCPRWEEELFFANVGGGMYIFKGNNVYFSGRITARSYRR